MTTFNTGNPLGSTDVYDRYDNSENLDNFSNGPLDAYPDRFGVSRKSWAGMEAEFDADQVDRAAQWAAFLLASGYQVLGPYGAGLVFTSYNQTFSYLGEFYAPSAGVALPYTTTGAGAAEIATFRSVGDAILRADLEDSSSVSKGAALVARAGQVVGSIAALRLLLKTSASVAAFVSGYYAQGDGGGGLYYLDAADVVSADNGGTIIVASDGGRWKLAHTGEVSVKQFGAKGDGVNDDRAAFVSAIASVAVVRVPSVSSNYLVSNTVDITKAVVIYGDGWQSSISYSSGLYTRGKGSWIKTSNPATPVFHIKRPSAGVRVSGVQIKNLAFEYDQPAPAPAWVPNASDFCITFTSADDCKLQNIMFWNPEKAVLITGVHGATSGRIDMDGIYGQPMRVGLSVDQTADVCRVNNVHFWPFWSDDADVLDWTRTNGSFFESARNDNFQGVNWFGYAYDKGLVFKGSAAGVTSRIKLSNIEFDSTRRGVHIQSTAEGATGQINNFSCVAQPAQAGADLFISEAVDAIFDWSNIRLTNSQDSAVRVSGSGAIHRFTSPWLEDWSLGVVKTNAGFFADAGATIIATNPIYTDDAGTNPPKKGGSGRLDFSRKTKSVTGTLNAEGKAVIWHGISGLATSATSAMCYFLDGALWKPMIQLYIDGTFTEFVTASGAPDTGKAYRWTVEYIE